MTDGVAGRSARQLAIRSLLVVGAALVALAGGYPQVEAGAQILPPILPPPPPESAFVGSAWDPEPPTRFTGASMELSGSFTVSGSLTIAEFELVLAPEGELFPGCSEVSTSEDAAPPGPDGTVEFSISPPSSLCNGVYQVTVTAVADSGEQASLDSNGRTVSLQPRAPSGVEAVLGATGGVILSWEAPDNAPDFLGYRLQRSVDGGPFTPFGPDLLDDTSFEDTDVPDGATEVDYKVASVRQGASDGTTVTALSGSTAVTLPTEPPPSDTTTSVAPGEQAADGAPSSDGGTTGASRSGSGRSVTPTTQFLPDIGRADDDPLGDAEQGDENPVLPEDELAGTVLQNFEDDAGDRRALMVPVAIGVVLLVWAMHLRYLARQAAR